MCSWTWYLMFGAWMLMAYNWYRIFKLYKETEKEVNTWMTICDECMNQLFRWNRKDWNL